MALISREDCEEIDAVDPIAAKRSAFNLPPGVIYLDGNSLGALTHAAAHRVQEVVNTQWGGDLIKSWNLHGWIDQPRTLGRRLAPLLGVSADEVEVGDSTSVNLFKIAAAAARDRGLRYKIVTERGNFPTDPYILAGLAGLVPGVEVVQVSREALASALDPHTFLVVLTHVHYQSAEMFDLPQVTRLVHDAGAKILWDLSHSVGAVPLDLAAADADFAVGCCYKYLNGGPGAPAFMYVRRDLQSTLKPVLSGWLGHARPFDFTDEYSPAEGMTRHRCGTPPIVAYAALEGALSAFDDIDIHDLRSKSIALSELFINLVESCELAAELTLVSPRITARRGSHLAFEHDEGYTLMQQIIGRGVIGDFRAPNLLRFGFAPLYLRYVDIWDAVKILSEEARHWREAGGKPVTRMAVT
ncbi:MAG: kynureninase [Gammaproteobacteria bacterium]